MRQLDRESVDEPTCLASYQAGTHNWGDVPREHKEEIRNSLEQMQGRRCAYCEGSLDSLGNHIEHFRRKGDSLFQYLTFLRRIFIGPVIRMIHVVDTRIKERDRLILTTLLTHALMNQKDFFDFDQMAPSMCEQVLLPMTSEELRRPFVCLTCKPNGVVCETCVRALYLVTYRLLKIVLNFPEKICSITSARNYLKLRTNLSILQSSTFLRSHSHVASYQVTTQTY